MSLTVYKRGEIYHVRGTVAGRVIRETTGTALKEVAEQIAHRIEAREWKRSLDGPQAVLRFSDASAAYRKAGNPPCRIRPTNGTARLRPRRGPRKPRSN